MQWWGWLIVGVVVVAVLVVGAIAVQARRRRGGVIVDRGRAKGSGRGGQAGGPS